MLTQEVNRTKVPLRSLKVTLHHAEFEKLQDWLIRPLCIFDISSICRLDIIKDRAWPHYAVGNLVERMASSLEELALGTGAYEPPDPQEVSPPPAVNLSILPRLRSLLLRMKISSDGCSLAGVIGLFKDVTLAHVSLLCAICTPLSDTLRSEWKAVDHTLAAVDCIQSVSLEFFSVMALQEVGHFALGVEECLTQLRQRGIVTITVDRRPLRNVHS